MLSLKPIQAKDNSYRTIAPPLQVQRPVFFLIFSAHGFLSTTERFRSDDHLWLMP